MDAGHEDRWLKGIKNKCFYNKLGLSSKLNVQKLINYVVTHQQVYSPYCPISYRASAWHYRSFFSFKMADSQSKTSNKRILVRRNIDQYSLGESA